MARVKSVNGSFHYSVFLLVFFIAAYTGFFSYLSVLKYKAFFSLAGDDLAISNNILWHSAKGNFFYQSIGEHLLDFHAGFFYFFLSAAYRLYPHIPTLFVFEHFALALGSIPLYYIGKKLFNSRSIAFVSAIAYLFSNHLHQLSFADQNPMVAFSATFFLSAFYFFYKRNLTGFVIFALLTMACREDAAFTIAAFSLYAFLKKTDLSWKLVPVLLGGGYFLVFWFFIGHLLNYSPHSNPYIWNFFSENQNNYSFSQLLFNNFVNFVQRVFRNYPLSAIINFFAYPWYCVFFLFSPLFLVLGLPTLLAIQLSAEKYFVSIESVHHFALGVPIFFLASLFGIHNIIVVLQKNIIIRRHSVKNKILWLMVVIFFILQVLTNFGRNILLPYGGLYREDLTIADYRFVSAKNMYDPVFYRQDEQDGRAWDIIKMIPEQVSVSTTKTYLAALSSRAKIFYFGTKREINDSEGHDFDADYIFLNKKNDYAGFGGVEVSHVLIIEKITLLLSHGYKVAGENEDFILLRSGKM